MHVTYVHPLEPFRVHYKVTGNMILLISLKNQFKTIIYFEKSAGAKQLGKFRYFVSLVISWWSSQEPATAFYI
jgi:hypothetical protein